ncbi:MAG: hypothetical protein K0S63_1410 [Gammaproteobacteria bacterium]|nr:hypothetical protein [Gammaproteobacteria bacterium]
MKEETFEGLLKKSINVLKKVAEIDKKYRNIESSFVKEIFSEDINLDILPTLSNLSLPKYKNYGLHENVDKYREDVKDNAHNDIIRACVISADRLVSALDNDLHKHIKNNTLKDLINELPESNICSDIEESLRGFPDSERTKKQNEVAQQLLNIPGIAVLAGAAGCGKTKIALEWAKLKSAQQIFWVCPRVQVCQGLFTELTSDQYLPNTKIEIYTGEFKFTNQWDKPTPEEQYFCGDVVITTIDQIFNAITTHNKVDTLIDFLSVHVVFDEFHEYINAPIFNLLFAELIFCKKQCSQAANTLLVSATPHYFYVKELLEIHTDNIASMPSFNKSLYKIDFKVFDETKRDESPLYQPQEKNTIVISNTAITAQKSFIQNQHQENAVLFHSKFKKSDKKKWFDEVYESFKKEGTRKFDILRSGPIVQASLNITCDQMVTEISSAEDFLQRLGRLDRFGINKTMNVYRIAVPESIHQGKGTSELARFLNRKHVFRATKAWYEMLQNSFNSQPITLPEIYNLYENFYQQDGFQELIETDLVSSVKASVNLINQKIADPICVQKNKSFEKNRAKISKRSLRGDNRFVQMAICDTSIFNQPKILNEYAYEISPNERDDIDNLTASRDEIEGYGNSNQNLLAYMMKKHHNIKGGKKAYKDFILLNEARDPEFPIYLSYTPNDLISIGGERERHSEAIYYAVCDKQPIGMISMAQLINNKE